MSVRSVILLDRDTAAGGTTPIFGYPPEVTQPETNKPEPQPDAILTECILGGAPEEGATEPACFPDLNLDQIVAAVTAGLREAGPLQTGFGEDLYNRVFEGTEYCPSSDNLRQMAG